MISNGCRCIAHHVPLLTLFLLVFLIPAFESALYPFGTENGDTKISWRRWGNGSEQIDLKASIPLLGDGRLSSVWVNTIGSLTYRELHVGSTTSSINSLVDNIALAPYFVPSAEGAIGAVYYRQTTTTDSELFQLITDDISSALLLPPTIEDVVTVYFKPTYALIVTWGDIASPEDSTSLNTFQIVLATDGSRAFAIYNYDDTMQWSSSANGEHAAAGIFASPNTESACSYELQGSRTDEVSLLSQTLGNSGELGKFILIISEPLQCISQFQSACDKILPSHDWGSSKPYFSIAGDSWDVYAIHTCNVGFNISTGVNSERIYCRYEPDYYSSMWEKDPGKCIDLDATKTFEVITEVVQVGNETVLSPDNYTEEEKEELVKVIENSISTKLNLTDVVITVTNITTGTPPKPGPEQKKDDPNTIKVTVEIKIPPYIHKKTTAENISTAINNDEEKDGGVIYMPTTEVSDLTDPCLQGCMCRFRMDPKLCPRGKNPLIKPDSCCGGCKGKPYSSSIKACCNNQQIYDPLKAKCCNGRVQKGARGKCL